MDKIRENLWITDIDTVQEQSTSQFDIVISVCQDTADDNVSCEYLHYPIADDAQSKRRWGGSTSYETFEDAALAVVHALLYEQNTLVHCHHGRNRSAAVCAAGMAVYEGTSFQEALHKVEDARPIVNPNHQKRTHTKKFVEEW